MPRFFLHIRDGIEIMEDPDGIEVVDVSLACNDALESARDLIADTVRRGEEIGYLQFEIVDEAGHICATVPFRSALRLA